MVKSQFSLFGPLKEWAIDVRLQAHRLPSGPTRDCISFASRYFQTVEGLTVREYHWLHAPILRTEPLESVLTPLGEGK